jgi:hypothetical protein
MSTNPPTIRSRELGFRLRSSMQAANINGKTMAREMGYPEATISRLINGQIDLRETEIAVFLARCGVTRAQRDAILRLSSGHHTPGVFVVTGEDRWSTYRSHASTAEKITEWAPLMVPWMFQTEDYTRALLAHCDTPGANRLTARRRLTDLTKGEQRPDLTVYLHETALRTAVADGPTMAEQAHHLLRMSVRNSVELRIAPTATGAHAVVGGPFSLLRFWDAQATSTVYRDGANLGVFFDDPAELAAHKILVDTLQKAALNQDASRALLRRLAVEACGATSEFEIAMLDETNAQS